MNLPLTAQMLFVVQDHAEYVGIERGMALSRDKSPGMQTVRILDATILYRKDQRLIANIAAEPVERI
jgi:hypothetical protein